MSGRPTGCRGPLQGGAGLPPPQPASGRPLSGGEEGGGGRGGVLRSPSLVPWRRPWRSLGGGLVVPVPGGQAPTGEAQSSPAPLHPSGARPSAGPHPGPPLSSLPRGGARWPRGGGGGGCLGQRFGSAVSGERAAGQWASLRAPCPRPLPYWRRCVPLRRTVGELEVAVWVGGPGPAWGGCAAALSLPHSLAPVAWDSGARPSPASSLA